MHSHQTRRRSTLGVLALALAMLLGLAAAPGASAATYRFWGYYQLKGSTWAFATKGADQVKPADGSIEGWRYAVGDESSSRTPRGTVTFDQVCKDTKAADGKKRVAVVIDYGRTADADTGTPAAPRAACAQVPSAATGAQVLAAVASVRSEKGLVCGVDSWPTAGCGGEVKSVSAAAKAADGKVNIAVGDQQKSSDSHTALITTVVVVVVALLLIAGLLVTLRRRRATESA